MALTKRKAVALTTEEADGLDEGAAKRGVTVSEHMRRLLKDGMDGEAGRPANPGPAVPDGLDGTAKKLAGIAEDLKDGMDRMEAVQDGMRGETVEGVTCPKCGGAVRAISMEEEGGPEWIAKGAALVCMEPDCEEVLKPGGVLFDGKLSGEKPGEDVEIPNWLIALAGGLFLVYQLFVKKAPAVKAEGGLAADGRDGAGRRTWRM